MSRLKLNATQYTKPVAKLHPSNQLSHPRQKPVFRLRYSLC